MAKMRQGVAVLAAADGIVSGLRDGESDIPALINPSIPETGKHAAGNTVRIDHGGGWETQYSHMLKGSATVHMGQKVLAGDQLGMLGLSGNTEFPHLDFTVRQNSRALDPFAPYSKSGCKTGKNILWDTEILNNLSYIPTGILLAG